MVVAALEGVQILFRQPQVLEHLVKDQMEEVDRLQTIQPLEVVVPVQ
jgi:hypothetical protein